MTKSWKARPTHRQVELAGNRQHRVAQRLGLQLAAVLPPEVAVVGVDRTLAGGALEAGAEPIVADTWRWSRSAGAAL
jgi:hypothetical protein